MSYANTTPPRSQFGLRGMEGGVPVPAFKSLQGEAIRRDAESNKRTMAITLVALGAGAVGLYFMAGGSSTAPGTPQVFSSVAQCVASGVHAGGVCEAQWNEASKIHDRAAPGYATMEACETAHGPGKCVKPATPDDAGRAAKYIPIMSGYFFGQTPQGTFQGVPLYSTAADGPGQFHVAQIHPKEPEVVEEVKKSVAGNEGSGTGQNGGSSSRTLLFVPLPAMAAPTPASAPAPAPRTGFAPVSSAAPTAPAAPTAAPRPQSAAPNAATSKPSATAATTRGGLGTAARSAGVSGGG